MIAKRDPMTTLYMPVDSARCLVVKSVQGIMELSNPLRYPDNNPFGTRGATWLDDNVKILDFVRVAMEGDRGGNIRDKTISEAWRTLETNGKHTTADMFAKCGLDILDYIGRGG
jgi:hypothetical protein